MNLFNRLFKKTRNDNIEKQPQIVQQWMKESPSAMHLIIKIARKIKDENPSLDFPDKFDELMTLVKKHPDYEKVMALKELEKTLNKCDGFKDE